MYLLSTLKLALQSNYFSDRTSRKLLEVHGKVFSLFLQDHNTPEASRAIIEYLKFRNNRISKRKNAYRDSQLEKQKVFSDDDYLFINSRIQKEYVESGNDEDRKLKDNTFLELYRSISEKCNMSSEKGKYNVIRSHNLRRYFYTTLTNNGCNYIVAELLMGHKLPKTQGGYYRTNPEKLRLEYEKYIPYLMIQKQLDVSVNPEYLKMKEQKNKLEKEVVRVSVEREEIQRMKTEYDQKMIDLEKAVRHQLQLEMRAYDKLKVASTGILKEHYAHEAQKVRDKLKK